MDAKEDVKSRLSIEDVISEYVQLKRAGRNFKGLSPFSNEKTPSFIVSPEKQIWHDFSSGKGGSMFDFVMEMEGLDFKATLELLARKAGIDLTQYQTERGAVTGRLKERLYEANETAARFYQVQFSKNKRALEYILKEREFMKETALEFRIGYAPNGGTALIDHLNKKGFSEVEAGKAGLITRRYRGAGDMFRGRIMIPLQDPGGRVIGFTARLLDDEPNAPKYINTPGTLLYDKSRHVYGLHLAKEAIRHSKYVVMVEGNLDVIASHQAGVKQVVATAGTALTEMHLKALNRFTSDVRIAFDEDKAGLAATERAIPIAGKVNVSLSIITVPAGKDPDELIKKDKDAWQKAIDSPKYALDWLIDHYKAQLDLTSAKGKRDFSDIILKVIRRLPDSVEQDHYIGQISEILGVSKAAMRQKFGTIEPETRRIKQVTPKLPTKPDKDEIERVKSQNQLLALTFRQPALRHYLEGLSNDMLLDDAAPQLLKFLQDSPHFVADDPQTSQNVEQGADKHQVGTLQRIDDYVKILGLLYEELYQGLELLELRNEAARLQTRLIEQYVKVKKHELATAMRAATENDMEELLEQAKALDKLLQG